MDNAMGHDIGAAMKLMAGHSPKEAGIEVINGTAIERTDFLSVVLHATVSLATGAPTSYTVDSLLEQSSDGSSNWTAVPAGAITTLIADGTEAEVDINLGSVDAFVRVKTTVAFVGGSSPTIAVAATLAFGGARELPV